MRLPILCFICRSLAKLAYSSILSVMLGGPGVLKSTTRGWAASGPEGRALATGATVSLAAFRVVNLDSDASCVWDGCHDLGTFEHIAWQCPCRPVGCAIPPMPGEPWLQGLGGSCMVLMMTFQLFMSACVTFNEPFGTCDMETDLLRCAPGLLGSLRLCFAPSLLLTWPTVDLAAALFFFLGLVVFGVLPPGLV